MSAAIWYLRTTFDRHVAYPNENLFVSATLTNPNSYALFIGSCYWSFTCCPGYAPGIGHVNKVVPPGETMIIPPWNLPIPNVPEGQYEAEVAFDTWCWQAHTAAWQFLGKIAPSPKQPFYIIHAPRFRAFISRSNHDADRPLVDVILSAIQKWGFDTHTVGINEFERDRRKVPDRIIQEITKADCVFAIATPRDVSSVPYLFRTLTWLHNEVSFSFMANKLTLLIADTTVHLNGLIGTETFPTVRYDAYDLNTLIFRLGNLLPVIRKILLEESYQKWKQQRVREIEEITYHAFVSGVVAQKRLCSDLSRPTTGSGKRGASGLPSLASHHRDTRTRQ